MTTKTRRMKITIERHDITILRRHGARPAVFCERCRAEVFGLTADETAALSELPTEAIPGLLQAAEMHLVNDNDADDPLICNGTESR